MAKNSVLQFHNYTVEELLYRSYPVDAEHREFELHPQFHHTLEELGDGRYDMHFSVAIEPDENHPLPFELRVSIVGHFSYDDPEHTCNDTLKQTVLHTNTLSILFPFLRSIVAALTTSANISPLIFPVMNFAGND